jgi:hypothetical protein
MPISQSVVYEPRAGESWRDLFPMYKALRDRDPVHRFQNGESEFWALSRLQNAFDTATGRRFQWIARSCCSTHRGISMPFCATGSP